MKVTISCGGKWCTFYQAEQLYKRDILDRIITGYPFFKLKEERKKIPEEKIISAPLPQVGTKILRKIPVILDALPLEYWSSVVFDKMASRNIDECDIFVGWASYCLNSMKIAKSYGAKTLLECGSAHILHQKKLVDDEYEIWGMKRKFADRRTVERTLKEYEETDYIIATSEFSYKSFISMGFQKEKIFKIPLGVDIKDFKQVPKRDDIFRVLFVGALTLRKGVPYLLEAMAGLPSDKFELLLIGGISEEIKPFLEKYQRKYRHLTRIAHKELYDCYSQSSVFIIPSIEDGFPQVVPEAMACGLPVIGTENTCAPDLVRDGVDGFVIPIRDADILREKIRMLYENEELRKSMGISAKKRIFEFTWNRWGEEALRCYKRLMQKNN